MAKKKRKVNCRICKEEMWFRNYGVHLTRAHPEANSSDLRAVNQQDLFSSFGTSTLSTLGCESKRAKEQEIKRARDQESKRER